MGVAKALFKVVGYTKSHAVIGGSGKPAIRNFCANCGSLVFGTPESAPHLVTIYAGSLDDPATFQPQIAVNTKSRSSWDRTVGQIPEFDTMPPRPPAN